MKSTKKYFRAFTLVELIIVITILAVLATIAFVSFSGYTKNSRDANRISTLGNVKKGLSIYFTQTGNYPTPESIYLTGNLNGTLLTQVGYLKDNISRLLNISKIPVDPQSGNNYVYATSPNNKHYQLGSTLEGTQNITQLIQSTYANNYKAYVIGEYRGLLNYNGYIYNLPSLIITGTGNLSITSYVINKGNNLPYGLNGQTLNNTQTVGEIFTQLTGTSSTLTGIVLPTNKDAYMSNSGTYKSALGYDGDIIGDSIFGGEYFGKGDVSVISTPVICNEFTYSSWGTCQVDNTQTRMLLTSGPSGCTGGTPVLTQSCTYIPPQVAISNLSLVHSANNKNFTFSWTGGSGIGNCKLQYLNGSSSWVDINGVGYNCDGNILNQSVALPADGWYIGLWSSISIRVVKVTDNSVLGQFSQNLTCNILSPSSVSTPSIDEDCDGYWDENAYYWKITGSTEIQRNCYTNRQDVVCQSSNLGTNLGALYGNGSDRFAIDGANLFYMQTCLDSGSTYIHYYVTCANDKYN